MQICSNNKTIGFIILSLIIRFGSYLFISYAHRESVNLQKLNFFKRIKFKYLFLIIFKCGIVVQNKFNKPHVQMEHMIEFSIIYNNICYHRVTLKKHVREHVLILRIEADAGIVPLYMSPLVNFVFFFLFLSFLQATWRKTFQRITLNIQYFIYVEKFFSFHNSLDNCQEEITTCVMGNL